MNNLSYSKDFGKTVETVIQEKEEVIDDRVVISEMRNEIGYFIASNGKPLVFANIGKAEAYIKKNKIVDYEIDSFQMYDFSGIEIIEL